MLYVQLATTFIDLFNQVIVCGGAFTVYYKFASFNFNACVTNGDATLTVTLA
jgi:hypothetical protein